MLKVKCEHMLQPTYVTKQDKNLVKRDLVLHESSC